MSNWDEIDFIGAAENWVVDDSPMTLRDWYVRWQWGRKLKAMTTKFKLTFRRVDYFKPKHDRMHDLKIQLDCLRAARR